MTCNYNFCCFTIYFREYDAAVPDDLYHSLQVKLEEAEKVDLLGGYNVSTILTSWDSFKGYPVVNIERDYETGDLTLTQVRFCLFKNYHTQYFFFFFHT